MAAPSGGLSRFYLLLGAAAAVGAAVIGLVVFRKPAVSIPANPVIQVSDTSGFRGYLLGSDSALLEVTEYADYECPACQQWAVVQFPTIQERLIRTGKVRWRYRDFPLAIHQHSRTAAHAAACANDQGKYWEMHRFIYESQNDWAFGKAAAHFRELAGPAGLDVAQYDACMASAKYAGRIQASYDEAVRVGAGSTPTLLIAGRLYAGGLAYDDLKHLVDSLAAAQAPAAAPATR